VGHPREPAIRSHLTTPSSLGDKGAGIETWRAALLALLIVLCLAAVTTLGSAQ
jgi:hypothetical protein